MTPRNGRLTQVMEDIGTIKTNIAVLGVKMDNVVQAHEELKDFASACPARHAMYVTRVEMEPIVSAYKLYRGWTWTMTLTILAAAAVLAFNHGLLP